MDEIRVYGRQERKLLRVEKSKQTVLVVPWVQVQKNWLYGYSQRNEKIVLTTAAVFETCKIFILEDFI